MSGLFNFLLGGITSALGGGSGNVFGNIADRFRTGDGTNPMDWSYGSDMYKRAMDYQNLNFRQQQFDYQKALQEHLEAREDTTLQRSIQDARDAGLSPLAGINGQAGAGSAVPVTGSDVTGTSSAPMNPFAIASMIQQLRTGEYQNDVLKAQAEKVGAEADFTKKQAQYFEDHGFLPTRDDKLLASVMQALSGFLGETQSPYTLGVTARGWLDKASDVSAPVTESVLDRVNSILHPQSEPLPPSTDVRTSYSMPSGELYSNAVADISKNVGKFDKLTYWSYVDDGKKIRFYTKIGGYKDVWTSSLKSDTIKLMELKGHSILSWH